MMFFSSVLLLALGVFLSGFFSGSETGFYRASRVRMVIAGLDGDRISQWLVKLINHPALFVATTLIGNNVANYVTSLAIVLLARQTTASSAGEMLAPILMTPLIFVYGELLPKNLFYQAPNFLLRLAAPLFLFFTVLFWPISVVLWGVSRVLEKVLGQSPDKVRLTLAKKEVQKVFEDGLEAGILHPTQRHLAQSFFLVADQPIGELCLPIGKSHAVEISESAEVARRMARNKSIADIPVFEGQKTNVVGYVRTLDLLVDQEISRVDQVMRQIRTVQSTDLFGEVILQMQANHETLLLVANAKSSLVGILSIDQLTGPLLNGPLESLKR
jgi:CBS domain containing-hemolysin-like protein